MTSLEKCNTRVKIATRYTILNYVPMEVRVWIVIGAFMRAYFWIVSISLQFLAKLSTWLFTYVLSEIKILTRRYAQMLVIRVSHKVRCWFLARQANSIN